MTDAAKLRSYVDRIERVLDEVDGLKADVVDIYTEVKGARLVPKIVRKVIARRRAKDKAGLLRDEDLLDTYLAALDSPLRDALAMAERGATSREIEQATGITRSAASRSVPLKKSRGTKPSHDPATGVIREVAPLGADAGQPSEPSVSAEQSVNSAPPPERVSLSISNGEETQPGNHSEVPPPSVFTGERNAPAPIGGASGGTVKHGDTFTLSPELAASYGFAPDVVLTVEADAGPMPSFLVRARA